MAEFVYEDLLPHRPDDPTAYRLLTTEGVRAVEGPGGRTFLEVDPEALRLLTETAMHDIAHYLRPAHLAQLRRIIDDPEASNNDRFVALDLLKNANIAAGGVLPMCQDTGTAIVMGKRGQHVLTTGGHGRGGDRPRRVRRLHPAQPALLADGAAHDVGGEEHRLQPARPDRALRRHRARARDVVQVPLHGQGRRLGQQVLPLPGDQGGPEPASGMLRFLDEKLRALGTAACPPYHLAIVIGGTSAEFALKTAKYASRSTSTSCRRGDPSAAHGFRDLELEEQVLELTRRLRHRRPVRRQVLLPRRARGAAAPPRRLAARSRSRSPARPTGRRWARSPPRASSSSSSRPTRPASCPRPPTSTSSDEDGPRATSCGSTSTARWPRSAPS